MNGDTGPCAPWPIEWCCPLTGVTPAVTGMAAEAATEVLWGLSGRQFGFCDAWVRPCKQGCFYGPETGGWPWFDNDGDWVRPALLDGTWHNIVCGACLGDCACTAVEKVNLPGWVDSVISVIIDDTVLPTGGAYRLDNHRSLVRTDGGKWPLCQDWGKDSGPGTWYVQTRFGKAVPSMGVLAASELASEFILACSGNDKCRLPQRVVSIDRNGLSIALDDVQTMLKAGQTGLTLCDMFLATYNPHGLRQRSKVYSPDVPRPVISKTAPPVSMAPDLSMYGLGTYGAGTYGGV